MKQPWNIWYQDLQKMLHQSLGDSMTHLSDTNHARDNFHDMYNNGLSPLDAFYMFTKNDGFKQDNTIQIA